MESNTELPKNKKSINSKYSTKTAIKNAVSDILKKEQVEGRYTDENWHGIQKLLQILHTNNIETTLDDSSYAGQGDIEGTNLPTRKIYKYTLNIRDKNGNNVPLHLLAKCIFVGHTGTMVDKEYELTLYFTN